MNGHSSNLDLFLTNISSCFSDTLAIPFSGSDHHLIKTRYHARGCSVAASHRYISIHSIGEISPQISDALNDLDWESFVFFEDVNECLTLVVKGLLELLFPLKSFRVRQRGLLWSVTPAARKVRRERDRAHRKAIKLNSSVAWAEYRSISNKCNNALRSMKARYYSDLATNFKNEPRKFWKNVSFLSNSTKLSACVNLPFSANMLNDYFCSVSANIVTNMTSSSVSPLSYLSVPTKSSFSFQPVAATDILRSVECLEVIWF